MATDLSVKKKGHNVALNMDGFKARDENAELSTKTEATDIQIAPAELKTTRVVNEALNREPNTALDKEIAALAMEEGARLAIKREGKEYSAVILEVSDEGVEVAYKVDKDGMPEIVVEVLETRPAVGAQIETTINTLKSSQGELASLLKKGATGFVTSFNKYLQALYNGKAQEILWPQPKSLPVEEHPPKPLTLSETIARAIERTSDETVQDRLRQLSASLGLATNEIKSPSQGNPEIVLPKLARSELKVGMVSAAAECDKAVEEAAVAHREFVKAVATETGKLDNAITVHRIAAVESALATAESEAEQNELQEAIKDMTALTLAKSELDQLAKDSL